MPCPIDFHYYCKHDVCFHNLKDKSKLFSAVIDNMPQMLSIELKLYWTRSVPSRGCTVLAPLSGTDPANRTIKCSVIPAGKKRAPASIDSFSPVFFFLFAPLLYIFFFWCLVWLWSSFFFFLCSLKSLVTIHFHCMEKSSMNMRATPIYYITLHLVIWQMLLFKATYKWSNQNHNYLSKHL